jgi:hypothetical protein
MHRMTFPLLFALFAAFGAVAPASRPAAGAPPAVQAQPAALDPDFMGMAIRDPWYEFNTNPAYPNAANRAFLDAMGTNLATMGVRWVRLEFHIPVPVDSPDLGAVDWEIGKNDYFINEVAPRHGFKVLGLLGFGLVPWSDPRGLNSTTYIASAYGGAVNRYMDTWLTRALRIADRYRDRIAGYEILNEQNRLPQFGGTGPVGDSIAPVVTARLMTKFYRFCKNIEPGDQNHGCQPETRIIFGGLHPRGTSDPANQGRIVMTDVQYVEQAFSDGGDRNPFREFAAKWGYFPVDGMGYHPYPEEIRLSPNDVLVDRGINRMRQALASVADPCMPFWVTEIGYNVGFDPDGAKNPRPPQTEAGQATFLQDVYTTLAARRLPAGCGGGREVANVFWFKYEDFPPAEDIKDSKGNVLVPAQKWGVVRIPFDGNGSYDVNGTPSRYRMAFSTYRALAGAVVYENPIFLPQMFRQ